MHLFNRMYVAFQVLKNRDEGATMVEYGIMVALIAAISIAVIGFIGQDVKSAFDTVDQNLP